jgi:hypothetical protein
MKTFNVMKKSILALSVVGLLLVSCSDSNDDITNLDTSAEDIVALQQVAEIDQIDNVLGDIIIDVYEQQENEAVGRSANASFIPDCVTITVEIQQNFRAVTIDFGTTGCLVQGHILRGQILMDYTRDPEAQQVMINYNLVDFFVDAKSVMGSRSILRELANANGNPQFTHHLDLTVIWPNGIQASREGTRIREWVEGFGSGTFSDNVFEITGDWTATFVNGNTHNYEVMLPLRREIGCMHFVSGTVDVTRTNFGGVFDFGDGTCDALATFTFDNGTEIEVQL